MISELPVSLLENSYFKRELSEIWTRKKPGISRWFLVNHCLSLRNAYRRSEEGQSEINIKWTKTIAIPKRWSDQGNVVNVEFWVRTAVLVYRPLSISIYIDLTVIEQQWTVYSGQNSCKNTQNRHALWWMIKPLRSLDIVMAGFGIMPLYPGLRLVQK